ncbi:helix-turn-helix transcriptional regulator [Streptomyces avicenniae]|uniref:helix-turn-helix transcriptional regulator n=1 Tax=Streptomyces avicenniae TaxID=500153 RepID=UPI000699B54A|nr:WYL domain-containing protein [Streptomyces avicenniae]
MRAARLIRMILLLQSRRAMTADELAAELDVSARTVARDVEALSEAGVPVYADRGRTGGYRLVGGYRTGLTGLARDEAAALFLSGVPAALRDMGLADAASAARLKVSAALRPELSDAHHSAAQRFHLDAPGWWQPPSTPALLPAVADAVWDDLWLTVDYARQGRDAVTRVLAPYGLVLKAGVWYLAARPGGSGDGGDGGDGGEATHRVYRVDRFTRAEAAGGRFTRDESFDLPGFWAERAAQFARSILRAAVEIRVTAAGARALRRVTDRDAAREALAQAGPPDGQGRITLALPVESLDVAFDQLLTLGPECEVLGPPELRERVADAARRTAALYAAAAVPGTAQR